jgi:hypothetical protein
MKTLIEKTKMLLEKEQKDNKILIRKTGKRKIVAFIGENTDGVYYAFGCPSQKGGYIAFNVESIDVAFDRIAENFTAITENTKIISNPLDIFTYKKVRSLCGVPTEEVKVLINALQRFEKTNDEELKNDLKENVLENFEFTEKEATILGLPKEWEQDEQPKSKLLNNPYGHYYTLCLSELGQAIYEEYKEFVAQKENLVPIQSPQITIDFAKEVKPEIKAEIKEQPQLKVEIVDYSEKAIAVIGDTKPIKEQLKKIYGRFNPKLKCGAGWIFSKKRMPELQTLIASL